MRKIDINKLSNIRCERCSYYKLEERINNRASVGFCLKKNKNVKYYNKCNQFCWNKKYLIYSTDLSDKKSEKIVCKRCGRPLTDLDSIARGFGKSCYYHRLYALKKRLRRLF